MSIRPDHIGNEDECIKVYDPSKQELLRTFDNYRQASAYLGISHKVLRNATRSKTRRFSPILNIEVAVRVKKKTEEDRQIIRKTIKNSGG